MFRVNVGGNMVDFKSLTIFFPRIQSDHHMVLLRSSVGVVVDLVVVRGVPPGRL